MAKNGILSKKKIVELIYLISRVSWPGLFLIFLVHYVMGRTQNFPNFELLEIQHASGTSEHPQN